MQPAALDASLAAVAEVERVRADLTRQWQLRRERAAYEVERASRQYHACEPENRLVVRELERRWNDALTQQRKLDDEYDRWQRTAPAALSDNAMSAIRALATDLPAVWSAATTAAADRQRIARLLVERVVVTVDKSSERVDVELHWVGGAVRRHTLARPVNRYDRRSDYPQLVARLRAWGQQRLTAATIAGRLNAEGFRPPKRVTRFTAAMVQRLLGQLELTRRPALGSHDELGPGEYRPSGLARKLGIGRDTVQRWRKSGWLTVRRDADGHSIIWADADELARLRELHRTTRTWATNARWAELTHPKLRPAT